VSGEALFPFYLPDLQAARLVEADPDYAKAHAREDRFHRITELRLSARVNADRTVSLSAWSASDTGFIQSAGTFWSKELGVDAARLAALVDAELERRAARELATEERAEYEARVRARAAELRARLLPG
jgi:hypothetical protein